jgi:hypothetical protein
MRKPTAPAKYRSFVPCGGFSKELKSLAAEIIGLQIKRYSCDYDPLFRVTKSDAALAVAAARSAIDRLQRLAADEKVLFLSLLLFKAR